MTSVTISGVSSRTSEQAQKLALLAKLFQTTGKAVDSDKTRRKTDVAAQQPPARPPAPAQTNSAVGLTSMFEALQNDDTSSVSDLLSRLFQAVDTDGDGTISADELQAVTELAIGRNQVASHPSGYTALVANDDAKGSGTISAKEFAASPLAANLGRDLATVDPDQDGRLAQTELDQVEKSLLNMAELGIQNAGTTTSAYEALFQGLQHVFAQPPGPSGGSIGQRYTDLLRSLARTG